MCKGEKLGSFQEGNFQKEKGRTFLLLELLGGGNADFCYQSDVQGPREKQGKNN